MRTLEKRCEMMDGGFALAQFLEPLEHFVLGARVERRRRLVENQQLRFTHVRARDGDLLPLAAGQIDAALESLANAPARILSAASR